MSLLMLLGRTLGSGGLPMLTAGTRVGYIGDSILAYNTTVTIGASKEFGQALRGEITWANILSQRARIETWRDITNVWGPYNGNSGSLGSDPFATTDTSATVTVTHTGHGMSTGAGYLGGAEYEFDGATAVNGLTLNGGYKVLTVPTANTFTISAGSAASGTGSGGGAGITYIRRSPAAVPQYYRGANWGTSADHTEGSLDVLDIANGLPTSGTFLDIDCDVIIIAIGTNDVNSSESAANIQTNITSVVNAALAHPNTPRVILCTIRPRGVQTTKTLPNDPFTTTNASATVLVSHPAHPYDVGQNVTFTGASAVGGLTLTGPYPIIATDFTADQYKITAGGTASSSATGGGSGVTVINSSANLVYPVDDARWTVKRTVNEFIRTNSWGPRVTVCDFDTTMLDESVIVTTSGSGTGAAKELYLIDGVHNSPLGSYYAAKDCLVPALESIIADGAVWYETDPTVAGNYLRNGPLTGTAGAASTGFTGTLPDYWIAARSGGSSLTGVMSKSTIISGIDKVTATLTSAGSSGVDTAQIRPANAIAYNRVATGSSLTFNTLATGLNPTVRVTHNTVTNGHPIVGSQITYANASGTHNGVTLNGTWTITAVNNTTTSNVTYEFVATGQTASATGSGAITIDTTYSSANLMPLDSWIRFGCYVEVGAWDKWRNIQMFLQTRNGATGVVSYRAGRTYDSNLRQMPTEAWEGWIVSDPIKLDSEALASVTNLFLTTNVDVENSTTGTTSAAISFSRFFLRSISDPTSDWSIGS